MVKDLSQSLEDAVFYSGDARSKVVEDFQKIVGLKADSVPGKDTKYAYGLIVENKGAIDDAVIAKAKAFEALPSSAKNVDYAHLASIEPSKYPPVAGRETVVTSPFAYRNIDRGSANHYKVDYRGNPGDKVIAPYDATITKIGNISITYVTENGLEITDTHVKPFLLIGRVSVGDKIKAGQEFARLGSELENGEYIPHLDRGVKQLSSGISINPNRIHTNYVYAEAQNAELAQRDANIFYDGSQWVTTKALEDAGIQTRSLKDLKGHQPLLATTLKFSPSMKGLPEGNPRELNNPILAAVDAKPQDIIIPAGEEPPVMLAGVTPETAPQPKTESALLASFNMESLGLPQTASVPFRPEVYEYSPPKAEPKIEPKVEVAMREPREEAPAITPQAPTAPKADIASVNLKSYGITDPSSVPFSNALPKYTAPAKVEIAAAPKVEVPKVKFTMDDKALPELNLPKITPPTIAKAPEPEIVVAKPAARATEEEKIIMGMFARFNPEGGKPVIVKQTTRPLTAEEREAATFVQISLNKLGYTNIAKNEFGHVEGGKTAEGIGKLQDDENLVVNKIADKATYDALQFRIAQDPNLAKEILLSFNQVNGNSQHKRMAENQTPEQEAYNAQIAALVEKSRALPSAPATGAELPTPQNQSGRDVALS